MKIFKALLARRMQLAICMAWTNRLSCLVLLALTLVVAASPESNLAQAYRSWWSGLYLLLLGSFCINMFMLHNQESDPASVLELPKNYKINGLAMSAAILLGIMLFPSSGLRYGLPLSPSIELSTFVANWMWAVLLPSLLTIQGVVVAAVVLFAGNRLGSRDWAVFLVNQMQVTFALLTLVAALSSMVHPQSAHLLLQEAHQHLMALLAIFTSLMISTILVLTVLRFLAGYYNLDQVTHEMYGAARKAIASRGRKESH